MNTEKDRDDDEWESVNENEQEENKNRNDSNENRRVNKRFLRYRKNFNSRRKKKINNSNKQDFRRRIKVENLPKDVNNEVLQKLFGRYGKLTRCGLHYDKLGNSIGEADIEYSSHEDCERAIYILDHASINETEMRVKYADNGKNMGKNSKSYNSNKGKSTWTKRRKNYLNQERRNFRSNRKSGEGYNSFGRGGRNRDNDRNGFINRRTEGNRFSRFGRNSRYNKNNFNSRNNKGDRYRIRNNRRRLIFKKSLGRRNRK